MSKHKRSAWLMVIATLALVAGCDEENNDWGPFPPNLSAPVVTAEVTQAVPSSVNVCGVQTTTLSASFEDSDAPDVGSFAVTFKIQQVDSIETLVNAGRNGDNGGRVTIESTGAGTYLASFVYDPPANHALGLYDLYFEVDDGSYSAKDEFDDNQDGLDLDPNNAPEMGSITFSDYNICRQGNTDATTTITVEFTDDDNVDPSEFTVVFKLAIDGTDSMVTLSGGQIQITDGASPGEYVATCTYNPSDTQDTEEYDLQVEISDGCDDVVDDFANNANILTIRNCL